MSHTMQSLGIDQLPLEARITLWHEIGDSIAKERQQPLLTDELRTELDRRIDEDDANPDDVIAWEEIEAEYSARAKKS